MNRAIGCDIDGVLANFTKGFTSLANELDSRAPIISDNQCPEWDYKKWYMGGGPEVEQLIEDTWFTLLRQSWFWADLEPLFPDDMPWLAELHREQPIVFMTRRDGFEPWAQTAQWLRRWGIQEPLLYRVHSGEEKSDLCKRLGISVVIEDSPKYAQELLAAGVRVVLIRWPYNTNIWYSHTAGVSRLDSASSLGEALSISRSLVSCDVSMTGAV